MRQFKLTSKDHPIINIVKYDHKLKEKKTFFSFMVSYYKNAPACLQAKGGELKRK